MKVFSYVVYNILERGLIPEASSSEVSQQPDFRALHATTREVQHPLLTEQVGCNW